MQWKYRVMLEVEQRDPLQQLLSKGKADVRYLKHAQVLLAADKSENGSNRWMSQSLAASVLIAGMLTASVPTASVFTAGVRRAIRSRQL